MTKHYYTIYDVIIEYLLYLITTSIMLWLNGERHVQRKSTIGNKAGLRYYEKKI